MVGESEIARLEGLSNKARKGIPIGINEALDVIEYQENLKKTKKKKKTFWEKLINKTRWDITQNKK